MKKLILLLPVLLLATTGCSGDGGPAAPQEPREVKLGYVIYRWNPTVEQPGLYDGTFHPVFVFNDQLAHTQIFDFVSFTRRDEGRSWEVASTDDHSQYDLVIAQITDGKSTNMYLNTCWDETTMCLAIQTTDDWSIGPGEGVEMNPDLIGTTITRFVMTLKRLDFVPYTGLFDGTTVNVEWWVDIYGYKE